MDNTSKAFGIWKHLLTTKQGFCFDELGVIWDISKCLEVIDKETKEGVARAVKEHQDLYYEHHIK